ncbi:hypothetical protein KJ855_02585, partial [Patescibacteria group bacterium]|nr:hypothetical protein [Patescibacteria group bacterium]
KKNVYLTFLTIAGVIALVLSFGPSIKMSDTRPKQTKNSFYLSDYLMTTDDTAIDMPYEFIYQKIPGISNMRAIHRWLLLFKFILIIAAAVYLSQLYKKYPKISVILTLIIFIEIFPNLRQTHNIYRQNYTNLQQFRHDVIEPLKAYINPGQTIFYLAPENTADWENDYLANYISANLNIHSYNCGGDKNMAIARSHWPEKILSMRDYENQNDDAFQALQNNDVDKIIIPNFSLRWDAYSWPPSPESYQQTLLDREAVFDYNDERFNIIFKKYFSIIDLKN